MLQAPGRGPDVDVPDLASAGLPDTSLGLAGRVTPAEGDGGCAGQEAAWAVNQTPWAVIQAGGAACI